MKRLILIRHGQAENQVSGSFTGSTDHPLGTVGKRQASALFPLLETVPDPTVFCSPMVRARQTARLALPGCAPTFLDGLVEIDFGSWEGKTFAEVASESPGAVEQWTRDESSFCFPDGEGIGEFRTRIARVVSMILAVDNETVLVFSHGGPIRTMVCQLLNLPLTATLAFKVDYASLTELEIYGQLGVLTKLG